MERFLNNPKHIQPYDIIYLCNLINKQDIFINIKADGVYKQFKYNNNFYEGEYIYDYTYIFDIMNYPKYLNQSYLNRIKFIKKQFDNTNDIIIIKSYDDFIKQIQEDDIYYLDQQKTNKVILKKSYLIKTNPEDLLKILEINLDEIIKAFPTDGFIIILDEILNYPFKYKPKNKLTIDLYNSNGVFLDKEKNIIFNNTPSNNLQNGIWRCYYINNKWVPIDFRLDKTLPNNQHIVEQIISEHHNYIKPLELLPFITKKIYYSHEKTDDLLNEIQSMLKYFNQITYNDLTNIVKFINKKDTGVLDIGCGKIKYINLLKNINYTGIDYDPICISKNVQKYGKGSWFWGNINNENWSSLKCPFDGFIKNLKYDLIILRNSINFIDNLNKFLLQLSQLCHNKTIVYIMMLDGDVINDIQLNEINIQKIQDNLYKFNYSWNNIGDFNDKVYTCSYIIELFKEYGFLMTKFIELGLEGNKYNQFIQFHKIMQFRYIK